MTDIPSDTVTAVSGASHHARIADVGATEWVGRRLGLPLSWLHRVTRCRRPAPDDRAARRGWVLELTCLTVALACLVSGVANLVVGRHAAGVAWLGGATHHLLAYGLTLRGRTRLVLAISLVSDPVSMIATAGDGHPAYAPSCLVLTLALIVCAISERGRVTSLYGLVLVGCVIQVGVAQGIPRADIVTAATVMALVVAISVVGSQVWTLTHDRTTLAMTQNLALTQQLQAANRSLQSANASLEARVAERTRELHDLLVHDDLTGLHNRRHFMARLEEALTQDRPSHLVMFDVDRFKLINDSCGHAAGDEVLRRVAHTMKQQVRAGDVLARIGGEEFAVLASATPGEDGVQLAERLCRAVEALTWPGDPHVPGDRVTLSAGVVQMDPSSTVAATLLRRADDALYESKRAGRNRVTCADMPLPGQRRGHPGQR